MSVVNVKVAHIRPKYNNLKEWMEDENNVYIGRRGIVFVDGVRFPSKDSIWCNPYKITADRDRNKVIELYTQHLENQLKNPMMVNELLKLKGKTLGCWCKPDGCHGDILLSYIEKLSE